MLHRRFAALLASAAACSLVAPAVAATAWNTLDGAAPIVIGHRGASGLRPEHTLEAYRLAIRQGASYIEPDLVMTRDGHLIARHEPMLDGTTDVAAKFGASRQSTRLVDGVSTTAYFASDFTLAEIKTLRAIQPVGSRPQEFNGLDEIPTLAEVISLARSEGLLAGRTVGIYPEIKHSTFHAALFGTNAIEDRLVGQLHESYGNTSAAPVFIQSFETANLRYLNTRTDIKLVQLIDANDVNADGSLDLSAPFGQPYDIAAAGGTLTFQQMLSGAGLATIATYADGIGPWKPWLVRTVADGVDRTGDGRLTINDRRVDGSTGVIAAAHAAGLLVHAFTFRDDASGYGFADPVAEMAYYFGLGVDGVFTDFPSSGVRALAIAAPIPEPGTWALMLAGIGAIGTVARRRQAIRAARS